MLNFDAYQRCETVRRILEPLCPNAKASLLDVGGYPGRMRSLVPQHDWVLCDPRVDSAGEQLRGDASRLPFHDRAFDVCVCMDVLEHIPQEKRLDVVREMHRAAKRAVIITCPHNAQWVKPAEDAVRELYRAVHNEKEHPWLSEHQQYDLPDVGSIEECLNNSGGKTITFDVGAIHRWQMLQQFGIVLELFPNAIDIASGLDQFYEETVYPSDFTLTAYRKVIVCVKEESIPLHQLLPQRQNADEHTIDAQLTTRVMLEVSKAMLAYQRSGQDSPTVSDEYISRMEKGLRLWEETYIQTHNEWKNALEWRASLEQRKSFRWYKKLLKQTGKPLD